MKLCVIPARGGSKRIPKKNIKEFCGKPIIAWSIEAAIASKNFDKIIVSTDDNEIAKIATEYGAEVPFMRPKELSDDHTATIPVIQHAIEWLIKEDQKPLFVCCIYPTAPFVQLTDLQEGFRLLQNSGSEFVFSATNFAYPIQRAFKIENKRARMFYPEHYNTRSQDLEEAYHDAGQFYWGLTDAWLKNKPIISEVSTPLIIPRNRVQDIDTPEDWLIATRLFEQINDC